MYITKTFLFAERHRNDYRTHTHTHTEMLWTLAAVVWRGMLVYWVALACVMHPGMRDQAGTNNGVVFDPTRPRCCR